MVVAYRHPMLKWLMTAEQARPRGDSRSPTLYSQLPYVLAFYMEKRDDRVSLQT